MKKIDKTIEFECLEMTQPIGTYYIGVMNYNDLIHVSYADVRRLEKRERDVEEYMGIQRLLQPTRVKEISKYVRLSDATFPTAVILSVSSSDVEYDHEHKRFRMRYKRNVAKVLDGQHRIAGLEDCGLPPREFQINVTLFVDMELEDQALVFATINQTQTKVNKSLVADLFEFATHRSPQKTCHNIARALHETESSPFFERIKILGTAINKNKETITQATFVNSLIMYITRDKMTDRDLYRRGKKPHPYSGRDAETCFLRDYFLAEDDATIANIVNSYFLAVQERWPKAWTQVESEMILNKSTGFIALMKFMRDCYHSLSHNGIESFYNGCLSIFKNVHLQDNDFNRDNYIPGSGGQSKLYRKLKSDGLSKG